ncbi:MAG: ribbon-helix-helix protein, CopG family [Candidatus Binataceae bacterium]
MEPLNVRIDSKTAAIIDRVARRNRLSKSEVVRSALTTLGERESRSSTAHPSQSMAHVIGCWDSGGLRLSERAGEQFARLLAREHRPDFLARLRKIYGGKPLKVSGAELIASERAQPESST